LQTIDQFVENTSGELLDLPVTTPARSSAASKSVTVLIIEDNLDMQSHIASVLKSNYRCLFADRGRNGVALALQEIPDVVICDVMMPGVDGYQVTRILRNDLRTSHIPIILLTALNTKESRIKGWRENIDVYVSKPFDATELNAQLENILSIRKLLQQKAAKKLQNNDCLDKLDLPKQDIDFINRLKKVISENYANTQFLRPQIASKMAVSERQLQRKTKALIDENPMDMLREHRLDVACKKLADGYQIGLVSDECGFNSVSYFAKCFKQKHGMTPKKYQQLKAPS